jgi:hypothetical protein
MKPILAFTLALCAFLGGGCLFETAQHETKPTTTTANVYHATVPPTTLRRVAVLPLTTDSADLITEEGRDALQPVLFTELKKTRAFELVFVSPAQLRAITGQPQWNAGETLPLDFFLRLHEALGCDAVIFCRLGQYRAYPPLSVGWDLKLVDANQRHVVWAIDEVFDAGDPSVETAARGYYERGIHTDNPLADPSSILLSPRRFGQYTASAALSTMPGH